ncbi:nucleotidyltransferase family protein [Arthrobacter crystallopoietes]|nr:nucleotidyltransferase domain-containing protein [Arthrobacter crystallopoietes]
MGVLDFLRQRMRLVKKLANINRIESVAVFASVARGEERADSDVDLLVRPNPEASLFDLAQFAEDMEELLGHPVDVVSRRGLDSVRDRNILSEALEL